MNNFLFEADLYLTQVQQFLHLHIYGSKWLKNMYHLFIDIILVLILTWLDG
jgi:hypothetical protein